MPSFHDIVGQHRSIRMLQSFLKKKVYPQALLFEGESGIGKRKAAEAFSQSILCQENLQTPLEPCGQCLACRKMKSQNHPDFLSISSDGSAIKIDQIREIQRKIIYKPLDGPYKIVVIDPADKMNSSAANSLLKTLEEPPPYVLLILISAKGASLLPTLRSRCQKISFQALSFSQIVDVLMKQRGMTEPEARLVTTTAKGQLSEALSMTLEMAKEVETAHHTLVESDDLFETATNFSGKREDLESALCYLMIWFRDVLVFQALSKTNAVDPELLIFSWRYSEIETWAGRMEETTVLNFLDDLQVVHQAQTRNVNRPLSLETLLLRLKT